MSEPIRTVRTDELRPGDRVWHPFDVACFTVARKPEPVALDFEGERGLRVTGTDDRGETVHVDVSPAYKWHRGPKTTAPTTHDPLVVNTRDGVCWTRRTVTSGGIALYAPERVKTCPEFVIATIDELAEQGIVGSADALPVPVGPEPQARSILDRARDALGARLTKDTLRLVLENVVTYAAELEYEREKLVRWHGEDGKTITTLVARVERRRAQLVALQNDALDMRGSLSPNGEDRKVPFPLGETLTPAVDWLIARVAELEAAPTTVYRAEHPDSGITLGHYGTPAAARAHCEATERRAWPAGTNLAFDWIEDDEDRVAELVVTAGQNEESTTGYIVTALELDSAYDPDGDE